MKNYAGAVEEAVLQYEPNQIIVANELYHGMLSYIPEQTFYKTMERLVKSGKLVHLTKGLYYRPKRTRFGNVPITEEREMVCIQQSICQKKTSDEKIFLEFRFSFQHLN